MVMSVHFSSVCSTDPLEDPTVSVPLPADLIAALRVAVFQRRSLGDNCAALEDLVKEAVTEWLEREIDGTSRVSVRL